MSRRASNRLDQRAFGPEVTFFVRIENCYERDLGQVQTFAQQIDANDDVIDSET
jgi:hypothetical protein